ncbi:hypothetical protein F5051DRAFT_442829 [Lentinula edodes]|nr:hypothetical protein F5051DRAFT_442829 [Lentinula edodes]
MQPSALNLRTQTQSMFRGTVYDLQSGISGDSSQRPPPSQPFLISVAPPASQVQPQLHTWVHSPATTQGTYASLTPTQTTSSSLMATAIPWSSRRSAGLACQDHQDNRDNAQNHACARLSVVAPSPMGHALPLSSFYASSASSLSLPASLLSSSVFDTVPPSSHIKGGKKSSSHPGKIKAHF